MTPMEKLGELRDFGGARRTEGLPDEVVGRFLEADDSLREAIDQALGVHRSLRGEWEAELRMEEAELCRSLQEHYVNFYPPEKVNPYVPLAACGPWIVTAHGAVVHDSGGYGMLGLGHGPPRALEVMARPWVMANVMTPSFSHRRLSDRLRREVGHTRGACPFGRFVCANSGSEAVTVALRLSDINVRRRAEARGRRDGETVKLLALEGGFHGRTGRPAQASASTRPKYDAHLASFRALGNLVSVPPNDCDALRRTFAAADAEGVFFESFLLEPVMGEGAPGRAITREFYDLARRLTRERGTLLLVDSIQAGLRAHGCLSVVDYPGFADAEPPDMETYSKALNAGQYPLSVLAVADPVAELYVHGVYGNTMTANPRALEVGCAVLDAITPELRRNVRERGAEFLERLRGLAEEFPGAITGVRGTGLLLAADVDPERARVVGFGGLEEYCRLRGVGVIHGGENALRFTPHFAITSAEIDVVFAVLRAAFRELAA